MTRECYRCLLVILLTHFAFANIVKADAISDYPIAFVTMVPNPTDFGTLAATFGNHLGTPTSAFRGGDLWIRYPNGGLKNLTEAAGFGNSGFQGNNSIAVRDPAVHWGGEKIIFSMLIGAPTARYQVTTHFWQLYEVTNLGQSQSPTITKIPNQPANYNNISPAYASDDSIIFISDRPRDDTVLHTYPQRDEYESSPVNSGLWKFSPSTGKLELLDHAPSGNFNPIIDSFGRVIFTRWDHLQRDQQNIGASFGAYNYASELSSVATASNSEVFPEARSNLDPDKKPNLNLHTLNQFLPWMVNQDGTELETLNHFGRQEMGVYAERTFNDDPNVQEFYGQYSTGSNQNEFSIFLHIKEDLNNPGTYLGTSCQEFGTHSAGQIISIVGPPGLNPDHMQVNYLTHPDTVAAADSPSANHSGLYRDALPISNGKIVASHTTNTRTDSNIGSSANPLSRYAFRLKTLTKNGTYYSGDALLTPGISKTISFWNPDNMVSYSGVLWEAMPVEVKSRNRPVAPSAALPSIEANIISSMGISVNELTEYLRTQNLALVISRNLTSRDKNDRQQPLNLRVTGTNTQSTPYSGKIYDISRLDFFQGDLIRSYNNGNRNGRRVLAQAMHSVSPGVNPIHPNIPGGSVKIAEDGSMAAFVPARRALSWQISSDDGTPVVRERYWVTFQPGEIRVCASCHGVNTSDQLGRGAPTNPPLALGQLLAHWKDIPLPEITPTIIPTNAAPNPTATNTPVATATRTNTPVSTSAPSIPTAVPTSTPVPPIATRVPTPKPNPTTTPNVYSITAKGVPILKPQGRIDVTATSLTKDKLKMRVSINDKLCNGSVAFPGSNLSRTLSGKLPNLSETEIDFLLYVNGSSSAKAKTSIALDKSTKKIVRATHRDICSNFLKSFKTSALKRKRI